MSEHPLVERRDQIFGSPTLLFFERPLHLVRGEGVWVFDVDGRRYLDMYNNIPVVGHCNPRVVDALTRQAQTLVTHTRYLDTVILDYGERLLDTLGDGIDRVIFTCSGTEANDVAMQIARCVSGGEGFICTDGAYHGNSLLVDSLTRAPLRGRPNVNAFRYPDLYRPQEPGLTEREVGEHALAEVRSAIEDFEAEGVGVAGLVLCSIMANEGLPFIPAEFMERAAEMVREAGGVVIYDEVQAGFLRTGRFWGHEWIDVEPDLVTMGKPAGNGLPLAACAGRADVVNPYRAETDYFNTFAGSALHGAVGLAVLDELRDRDVEANVNDVGAYLKQGLEEIAAPRERFGAVRQRGLFIGIEYLKDPEERTPDPEAAGIACEELKDRGFLTGVHGLLANQVKLRPPLIVDRDQADLFLEAFADVAAESDSR